MAFTVAARAQSPAGVVIRALSDEDEAVSFVVADVAQVIPTIDVIRAGDSMLTLKAVNALDQGRDLFDSSDTFAPVISAHKLFVTELGEAEPTSDDLAARISSTLGVDGTQLLSDLRESSPPDQDDPTSKPRLTDEPTAPSMLAAITVPELFTADEVTRLLHGTALIDGDGDLWFAVTAEDTEQMTSGLDPDRVAEMVGDAHRCQIGINGQDRHTGLAGFGQTVTAAVCVDLSGLVTLAGSGEVSEPFTTFTAWFHSPRPSRVIEDSSAIRAAMARPRVQPDWLTLSECADQLQITPLAYALALREIKALDRADSSTKPWTPRNASLLSMCAVPEHSAGMLWVPVVRGESARDQLAARLRARGLVG